MAPPVYKIYIPTTSSSLARVLNSNRTETRDSVSCCLLVTAQLVGRISNIFSFIIILLRPLHLPLILHNLPPYCPPTISQWKRPGSALSACWGFSTPTSRCGIYYWIAQILIVGRVPPVNISSQLTRLDRRSLNYVLLNLLWVETELYTVQSTNEVISV